MDQIEIYIGLLSLSVMVSFLFRKTSIPPPLLLLITGLMISLIPHVPRVQLNPELVLDIFLPMLIYPASALFSWRDVKSNLKPILFLSIGHVLFIAALVAVVIHALIPELGWARAIILGAIVSPPDDIAIMAIAEKVPLPNKIFTILKGESLLNDATALILFRFALAALITHEFFPWQALSNFIVVILSETAYGFLLGHIIGKIRLRIKDPSLQMIVSILTPFIAYLPAEKLGGCGVLATVVTGFVIGYRYLERFPPEARLTGRAIWMTISTALTNILFLLVGLDLHFTIQGISSLSYHQLFVSSSVLVLTVVIGRFVWIYSGLYLPHYFFPKIFKNSSPPWQRPFIISWSGMRGGISLAAALALPILPTSVQGSNPRDFIIFLVFCVILATLLIQGLSLQWLLKTLGINLYGQREKFTEHLSELNTRETMIDATLAWLNEYRQEVRDNGCMADRVDLKIREYQIQKNQLSKLIKNHDSSSLHDEDDEMREANFLALQINDTQRAALHQLWEKNKISHGVWMKLLQQLDYRSKHISG